MEVENKMKGSHFSPTITLLNLAKLDHRQPCLLELLSLSSSHKRWVIKPVSLAIHRLTHINKSAQWKPINVWVISGLSGKHRKLMPAPFYSSVDLSDTFTAGRERQRWWDRDAFGTRLPAVYSVIQRTDKWISFLDLRLCVSIELCSKTWMDGRSLSAFCHYDFRSGNVRSLNMVWGFYFLL